MNQICKSFPGVRALDKVNLRLERGEVLALLGENGAGKSTLIKALSGAVIPDSGNIRIDGKSITIHDPVDAQNAGVAVIYQEFNLVPYLSARENIFLGREKSKGGFFNRREENRNAAALFDRVGVKVNPETPCNRLSVAQQQAVEIAKALSLDARIIVMDEPSATLTLQEVESLFAIIRDLKSQGIGVIYISHRLDEIFEIADRVMVMLDGHFVGSKPVNDVTRSSLIEMMVGRALEE
ncbi:MAG: ATP-binding cassette domain-containing protein, partial [Planctomycetota bacterium]|nr:ATP-binding cassette domain-containing protein [Planctomycetota bacterium]